MSGTVARRLGDARLNLLIDVIDVKYCTVSSSNRRWIFQCAGAVLMMGHGEGVHTGLTVTLRGSECDEGDRDRGANDRSHSESAEPKATQYA